MNHVTPFEAWTGDKPDVSHLRSFGCTAYAHIPKDERKKLDSKARKCIFLGYGTETKGYRLYDCKRKGVFYSRGVKFSESEFGIEKEPCDGPDKLITIELSCNDDVIKDSEILDVRRSTRERRPPDRLGEWVTIASNDTDEPTTVRDALSSSDSEHWRQAMQNEMNSL